MNVNNDLDRNRPAKTGVEAKQGDRRTVTLWILIAGTILAVIVGWILVTNTEEYTADQPVPIEDTPNTQSPPIVPGREPS